MKVEILGTGCYNCLQLENLHREYESILSIKDFDR